MPLIAIAYAAFAAGLFAGFAGKAWMAVVAGVVIIVAAAHGRSARRAALGLVLTSGALVALASARPHPSGAREPDREDRPHGFLDNLQRRASRSVDRVFGADAPMARALLIADQHRIPPEMRDRYARAGMIHMLSISGLHVAIVAGAVLLILQSARVPRRTASVIGVALTAFYVAVIGAPPPAVRSAAMLGMVAASSATQRPTSPWAGLAIGAFLPLVAPRTILDLGYQLSVAGIAGLIASGMLARRLIAKRFGTTARKIAKELLTSIVATLVTAPLIAWYFGRISIVAPVANLVAGPVVTVLQPTLFLALICSPVPPVARFFADAAHPMLRLFDGIATIASQVPLASIDVVPSMVTVVLSGVAVIAFIAACMSRYPARHAIAGASCMSLVIWSPAISIPYHGQMEMHVLDVGQGDAILIRTDRGQWLLFDAGRIWKTGDAGRSTIIPYVMRHGGSVAGFILSHAHADHVGGAESVMKALHPRFFRDAAFAQGSSVYLRTLETAQREGVSWKRVHADDTMRVDGVRLRFLAPDSAWTASLDDPNEASTIVLVEYGATRFLFMGDAERAEERWLIDHAFNDLRADVLKVGHHGSSTSSTDEFLAAVQPALAVISVGADNLYGHPSADVLASLGRIGARTVRTDLSGTIVIRSDGRRLTYEAGGETWDISRR